MKNSVKFTVVGQTHAKWQTFENLAYKYKETSTVAVGGLTAIHLSLIFVFSKCLSFHVCFYDEIKQ